ncbi:MAG: Holliday junction branch migration protein RuvA [Thermodesulfobacteriota bacterium]
MIGTLRGKILFRGTNRIVLEAGGVGYELAVPLSTVEALPADGEAFLYVHTSVRENALELFGFRGIEEKALFEMLIGVSGVGPKTALAVLSGVSVDEFRQAVLEENSRKLSTIPGIGKKSADRIVLELKGKIRRVGSGTDFALGNPSAATVEEDLVSSLVNLGYAERVARAAAVKVLKEAGKEVNLTAAVKSALKELMK